MKLIWLVLIRINWMNHCEFSRSTLTESRGRLNFKCSLHDKWQRQQFCYRFSSAVPIKKLQFWLKYIFTFWVRYGSICCCWHHDNFVVAVILSAFFHFVPCACALSRLFHLLKTVAIFIWSYWLNAWDLFFWTLECYHRSLGFRCIFSSLRDKLNVPLFVEREYKRIWQGDTQTRKKKTRLERRRRRRGRQCHKIMRWWSKLRWASTYMHMPKHTNKGRLTWNMCGWVCLCTHDVQIQWIHFCLTKHL